MSLFGPFTTDQAIFTCGFLYGFSDILSKETLENPFSNMARSIVHGFIFGLAAELLGAFCIVELKPLLPFVLLLSIVFKLATRKKSRIRDEDNDNKDYESEEYESDSEESDDE